MLFRRQIWWLEGEGGVINDGNNIYINAVIARFTTEAGAKADGGWNYGVYAINLTMANGDLRQDQLFYVPDSGMTLMLLGGALMGLGALRRKFGA